MSTQRMLYAVLASLMLVLTSACASHEPASYAGPAAVIEKFEVTTRKPAFAGKSFVATGAYETIAAVTTVRLDPRHPANLAIADAEGELCGLNGLYVPLARDAAERAARRDPRPSIAERYASRSAYVQRVQASARQLVSAGFMLDEDVARWVERASSEPRVAALPQ